MKVILCVPDEGYSVCTWWRLFCVYLMKVILCVPDEDYSVCTWWRLFCVHLMKVILCVPDEGYSVCTWWRLFCVYLMKVILCVPDEDYSRLSNHSIWSLPDKGYSRLSNHSSLSVPDECYSRNASCVLNLISTFLLLFACNVHVEPRSEYIRYSFYFVGYNLYKRSTAIWKERIDYMTGWKWVSFIWRITPVFSHKTTIKSPNCQQRYQWPVIRYYFPIISTIPLFTYSTVDIFPWSKHNATFLPITMSPFCTLHCL
jgi:hypothetical protein